MPQIDIVQKIKAERTYRDSPLPDERQKNEYGTLDLMGVGEVTIIKPSDDEMRRSPAMLIAGILYAILEQMRKAFQGDLRREKWLERIAAQGVQVREDVQFQVSKTSKIDIMDTQKRQKPSPKLQAAMKWLELGKPYVSLNDAVNKMAADGVDVKRGTVANAINELRKEGKQDAD